MVPSLVVHVRPSIKGRLIDEDEFDVLSFPIVKKPAGKLLLQFQFLFVIIPGRDPVRLHAIFEAIVNVPLLKSSWGGFKVLVVIEPTQSEPAAFPAPLVVLLLENFGHFLHLTGLLRLLFCRMSQQVAVLFVSVEDRIS